MKYKPEHEHRSISRLKYNKLGKKKLKKFLKHQGISSSKALVLLSEILHSNLKSRANKRKHRKSGRSILPNHFLNSSGSSKSHGLKRPSSSMDKPSSGKYTEGSNLSSASDDQRSISRKFKKYSGGFSQYLMENLSSRSSDSDTDSHSTDASNEATTSTRNTPSSTITPLESSAPSIIFNEENNDDVVLRAEIGNENSAYNENMSIDLDDQSDQSQMHEIEVPVRNDDPYLVAEQQSEKKMEYAEAESINAFTCNIYDYFEETEVTDVSTIFGNKFPIKIVETGGGDSNELTIGDIILRMSQKTINTSMVY